MQLFPNYLTEAEVFAELGHSVHELINIIDLLCTNLFQHLFFKLNEISEVGLVFGFVKFNIFETEDNLDLVRG